MKALALLLAAVVAAVAVALLVLRDPGYVLIAYGHWRVETTLSLAAVVALLGFVAFYLLLRSVSGARHLPGRVRHWRVQRAARRSRGALTRGLLQLAEGRWADAERTLARSADAGDAPLLHYLGAARAAQRQGAHDRRDRYLARAHESMPEADVAVGLTQAEMQIADRQSEQALATLTHLRTLAPRHVHVLKLLAALYGDLHEWAALRDLLPELRRRRVVDPVQTAELERRVHVALLDEAARDGDLTRLRAAWARVPRRLRHDEAPLLCYVGHLREFGTEAEAEPLLREALQRSWSEALVARYGVIADPDPGRQLKTAESWLSGHERDPVLLLALGRLCLRNRLWGKARSYLEASIGAGPQPAAYRELGRLLEQLGEQDAAREHYRKGLDLAVETDPRQPGPVPQGLPQPAAAPGLVPGARAAS